LQALSLWRQLPELRAYGWLVMAAAATWVVVEVATKLPLLQAVAANCLSVVGCLCCIVCQQLLTCIAFCSMSPCIPQVIFGCAVSDYNVVCHAVYCHHCVLDGMLNDFAGCLAMLRSLDLHCST
jgi:hypothetical protein